MAQAPLVGLFVAAPFDRPSPPPSSPLDPLFQEASPEILKKCASSIAKLVRGSTHWEDLKPAYDQGLVALVPQDRTVVPISSVAASVLHAALAELVRKELKDTQR